MKISINGLNLIKEFEGLRLEAYLCSAGVLTIGYGHTAGVRKGDVITKGTADKMLVDDIGVFEQAVSNAVTAPLTQNQFDALVSLAFNIGATAFTNSTLVKKLNLRHDAADEFLRWRYVNRVESPGLLRRREAERALFLS